MAEGMGKAVCWGLWEACIGCDDGEVKLLMAEGLGLVVGMGVGAHGW